jgi:hypothetical protein
VREPLPLPEATTKEVYAMTWRRVALAATALLLPFVRVNAVWAAPATPVHQEESHVVRFVEPPTPNVTVSA